ncbi:peptidoglycan editing factor PgeF [Aliifodinibius sp. S!AR15-10]|uniref:peptidoglycan editing factor PgeF n=1 Tax=Aliifodinibius sp. S!AR15-10 TaxID=2950437 RepID=UPI00286239B4|nr:peptidoglycan editing factor PgeF [Aliifodinibius sp. S!AR15-10]MDR8392347.1 peptidoglycan editing factor PgeF [Aliifodinibius sp. S!AR15-10]
MSTFTNKLDLIEPAILNDQVGIKAWFTQKNADKINETASIPGLDLGFNTRTEREQVVGNRDLLFKMLSIEPDWTAFAEQVHGTRVQKITSGGIYPETDGLVTRVPGLALGIQVADCAAVLLADPVMKIVTAIHAGWRGATGNILINGLEIMKEEGSTPSDVCAWVSPAICQKHFEVGEEVAEQFPDDLVDRTSYQKPHVDLKGFIRQQLIGEGLDNDNIQVADGCTVGNANSFYSYRRENDNAGRMMAIIQIAD